MKILRVKKWILNDFLWKRCFRGCENCVESCDDYFHKKVHKLIKKLKKVKKVKEMGKNVAEIFIEKEKTHINYDSNYYKNKKEAIESAIDVLKLILIKGK